MKHIVFLFLQIIAIGAFSSFNPVFAQADCDTDCSAHCSGVAIKIGLCEQACNNEKAACLRERAKQEQARREAEQQKGIGERTGKIVDDVFDKVRQ